MVRSGLAIAARWGVLGAALWWLMVATDRPVWAFAVSVPILISWCAVEAFSPRVREDWSRAGWQMAADSLALTCVLLGARPLQPWALVGLGGVLITALALRERPRILLGNAAFLLLYFAISASTDLWMQGTFASTCALLVLFAFTTLHLSYEAPLVGVPFRSPAASPAPATQGQAAGSDGAGSHEVWPLLDITETITRSLEVDSVMHAIVERVGSLMDTPSCSVLVADANSPGCFVMASRGHPEADQMEIELEDYPEIRQAMRTGETVVVEEIAEHPMLAPVREKLLAKGYRSLVVLPLSFGEEVLGAMFLRFYQRRTLSRAESRFLKITAGLCANALKNAFLFREIQHESAKHLEIGEKLRGVLDASPDLIVATDAEGKITEFNRGAEELTGWTAERALGHRLPEILGDAHVAAEESTAEDVEIERVDGARCTVSLVSGRKTDGSGNWQGRVWIGRDVTRLRRVEHNLAQAERLSSLGEVVAGVAHELNNPLSGVVGYAEILRQHATDPGQISDLQRIVESAMRCQKIVCKLLSFARKHPPEKRRQNLNACVEKVLELKGYHLKTSMLETVLELDSELPDTQFDFHQIEQVILNLLNNAEQAIGSIKRGGTIRLSTGRSEEGIWVEVEDDGPGVPEELRDRLFDPFFTTKELGKGTGLGLSVSYGIVEEHDGSLELLEPEKASGARFRLTLPLVEGTDEQVLLDPATLDHPSWSALRGASVLIAEDDQVVLELLGRLLADVGAEVSLAADGEQAWERIREDDYDLIVTDLRMPELGGQGLYERVAEHEPRLLRRFVFSTGDLVRPESVEFLKNLPNRILPKPLEVETVRRVLAQALESV